MEYFVIGAMIAFIILLLIFGTPLKLMFFIGQGIVKIMIGAIFLFFLNAIGSHIGIHVPINLITATISGFLGIPGVLALAAIQYWILT